LPAVRAVSAIIAVFALLAGAARAELLSADDQAAYRSAFAAARSGNWGAAHQAADRGHDPLLGKVLRWLELSRSSALPFSDFASFLDSNSDFPLQATLRERAEQVSASVPDQLLLPYFEAHEPTTPAAQLRFADMLAAAGKADRAAAVARAAWLRPDLDAGVEAGWLDRFGGALRPEDHAARLDRLLWEGAGAAARRQLPRAPVPQRLLGEARLGLIGDDPSVETLLERVPPELRHDPGLLLDEARWNRRHERLDEAARILMHPPSALGRPTSWLTERQVLARRLIDSGAAREAYALTEEVVPAGGKTAHPETAMLAGWIALRRLNEPAMAGPQFAIATEAAATPGERARGAYWAGRAAEARGEAEKARAAFATAAELATTFYGQLAAARAGIAVAPRFPREPRPSREMAAAFEANELARAVRMLGEIGETNFARPFLLRLSADARTAEQQMLVVVLAQSIGRADAALVAARRAGADGVPLLEAGFPVMALPPPGTPPSGRATEDPLILAVTRQESGFDPGAVSRNDARGLMQLLPSTAKGLAKSLGLPFSGERLLSDPTYNLTLGRVYLGQMLDRFGGSYLLAIAAYNAGPARLGQWVEARGDPRGQKLDAVIDWIELIPYAETRSYVQHVLENLEIYRLRLGDAAHAFTLADDLTR
jgi:soluble lytic murein transglycosylase